MIHRTIGCIVLGAVTLAASAARGETPIIDAFLDHVAGAPNFDETAKAFVAKAWLERDDDAGPNDFIPEALAVLSPRFKQGLDALDDEQNEAAARIFGELATADDPYLSLHAAAFQLKALVYADRLREAGELAAQLYDMVDQFKTHTYLAGEITYLHGYCQLQNLHYLEAADTLMDFGGRFPEAPERLRLTADQMTREILLRQEGDLSEVSDLMRYAGRELGHGEHGEDVTEKQDRVVALLDDLIEQAEQSEQSNSGSNGGSSNDADRPQGQAPTQGAQRSQATPSQQGTTRLRQGPTARPGEAWGNMRPADRDKVLQPIRDAFPGRYLDLIEQYYRELSK